MKELFDNIILFAAIQGFLFSVFLFRKKQNREANKVLAFAILCLSINLVVVYLSILKVYEKYPILYGATLGFSLLYGPLFYLYTLLLTKRVKKIGPKHLFHFIPFIFIRLYLIPYYFLSHQEKLIQIEKSSYDGDLILNVYSLFMPIYGFIYTVLSLKVIKKFNEDIKIHFSNIDKIKVNWLRFIIIGGLLVWIVIAFAFLINIFFSEESNGFNPVYLAISVFIYAIGYSALNQPEIFIDLQPIPEQEAAEKIKGKYEKSYLADADIEGIKQSLISLMQKEKLFLNSELNINQISEKLNITNHNLSEVLSKAFNKNFYDFINSYRVEEFKERIKNPDFSNYSLLAIAFESGFSSKSTFNTIFKKYTKTTPSEYRKQNTQKLF